MARHAAKHMKKSRMNIPMCLAFVLFCLTLFSMHFRMAYMRVMLCPTPVGMGRAL